MGAAASPRRGSLFAGAAGGVQEIQGGGEEGETSALPIVDFDLPVTVETDDTANLIKFDVVIGILPSHLVPDGNYNHSLPGKYFVNSTSGILQNVSSVFWSHGKGSASGI